jgi:hypothetical protein
VVVGERAFDGVQGGTFIRRLNAFEKILLRFSSIREVVAGKGKRRLAAIIRQPLLPARLHQRDIKAAFRIITLDKSFVADWNRR